MLSHFLYGGGKDQEQFAGAVIYITVEMLLWRKSARAPRLTWRSKTVLGVGKFHENYGHGGNMDEHGILMNMVHLCSLLFI